MNIKHLASSLVSIFSLAILTTAGCSAEPTDDTDDMGEEYMEFEIEEDTDTAESALTASETTIQNEHRKIKSTYSYDNTTKYNNQTLPACAKQELDKINTTGVWNHYACTAGKLKNLYASASTASVPGVNWPAAINGANGWKNSPGHLSTIQNHKKVGCSTIAGTPAMCKATFGSSFPYCRIYSCAYSN